MPCLDLTQSYRANSIDNSRRQVRVGAPHQTAGHVRLDALIALVAGNLITGQAATGV
jgi:hypothetical protein